VNQLQLGNRTYNHQELQSILEQPVRGNGLVQLAQQEIAAKLNIANGTDGSCIVQTLAAVDVRIGNLIIPPVGNGFLRPSVYARTLTLYNGGGLCSPRCEWSPPPRATPTPSPRRQPTAATSARAVITTNLDNVAGVADPGYSFVSWPAIRLRATAWRVMRT